MNAGEMGVDVTSPDSPPADDFVPELQEQTTSLCDDVERKTRRGKSLSVLHVIRDKLKPSISRSRSAQATSGCSVPAGPENCCSSSSPAAERGDFVPDEGCGESGCTGHCTCIADTASPAAECELRVRPADDVGNFGDRSSSPNSAEKSVAGLRCSANRPHLVHGGLVLSQLSNFVATESSSKRDEILTEESSRLTLSPLSNSDSTSDLQTVKWTLANELLRLSRYGWYWGPVSREEAEEKLSDQPEGAFLVRDSTDDRYLFSLSFRSSGRTLHTRVEYCNGEFSFYAQPQSDSYGSMAELIAHCVAESEAGIYCYSRGTAGANSQSYPVKLTRPVSRFSQVRSLQYLCRFVIRQHTRVDHIQSLPLPISVKGWLKENQY